MVLDHLERQKDQPDPELLQDLNWSQDDLQEFLRRWQEAKDLGENGTDEQRLEWKEKLRSLNLKPPLRAVRSDSGRNDTFQQMQDSGSRVRPPEFYRKQFQEFQERLRRQN